MFRKIAIAAGLSTASLVAFPPAASAQSVTFSIGSGGYGYNGYGYNSYGYANSYPGYAYTYSNPQYYGSYPAYGYNGYNGYNAYNSYNGRAYEWAQRRYAEQLERWQRERAREEYRRRDHWDNGDDDDGD